MCVVNDLVAFGLKFLHEELETGCEKSWVGLRSGRKGVLNTEVKLPSWECEPASSSIGEMLRLWKPLHPENPGIELVGRLFLADRHSKLEVMEPLEGVRASLFRHQDLLCRAISRTERGACSS